jgi:hypothetical protein
MSKPLKACVVHKHRDDVPLDSHHIHPKQYGGPSTPDNLIWVCPNGHREIHNYLRLLLRQPGGKKPSWIQRRKFGRGVRKYAELGFARITGPENGDKL